MGLKDATYYLERMGESVYPAERGAWWVVEFGHRAEAQQSGPLETKHRDAPEDGDDFPASLPAFVNRSRWVVACPCGGAQLVCRTDLRTFCLHCGNAGFDGKWVAVDWPGDAPEIESILLERVYEQNRNWEPNETLEQLRLDNNTRDLRTGDIDLKKLPAEPTDPRLHHAWAGLNPDDYVPAEEREPVVEPEDEAS